MKEDAEILELVKGAYAGGVALDPARQAALVRQAARHVRFRRLRRAAMLLAAVLTVTVAGFCLQMSLAHETLDTRTVTIIELLNAADGGQPLSTAGQTAAETLLAWQDAPYFDVTHIE